MLMRSGEPPAPVTLPLLCALGRHKTDGLARWNAGYYFARCTRCRRDLVRTAFTRWQIPRGFRVVWQGDGFPAPVADFQRPVAAAGQVEFPIRDEPRDVPADLLPHGLVDALDESGRDDTDAEFAFDGPELADAPALDEGSADATQESKIKASEAGSGAPSWFDRDHDVEQDVAFGADDRLADYAEAEADDVRGIEDEELVESDEPVEAVAEPDPAPVVPPAPPVSSKYPVVPDFMDEGPGGVGWDVVSGHIVPQRGTEDASADAGSDDRRPAPDVPTGLLSQNWHDLLRKRAQGAGEQGRQWLRSRRAAQPPQVAAVALADVPPPAEPLPAEMPTPAPATDVPPVPKAKPLITVSDDSPPTESPQAVVATPTPRSAPPSELLMQYSPILAALVFGTLVLAAAVVDGRNGPARVAERPVATAPVARMAASPPAAPAARPAATGWTPVPSDVAYVTAGLLNCRATPDNDSETLRRLSRGAPVRLLGASPGWFSVAHQGRQCWVSSQHVSRTKPA